MSWSMVSFLARPRLRLVVGPAKHTMIGRHTVRHTVAFATRGRSSHIQVIWPNGGRMGGESLVHADGVHWQRTGAWGDAGRGATQDVAAGRGTPGTGRVSCGVSRWVAGSLDELYVPDLDC